ncbi:hypothetical protein E4U53_006210 [Claviceps sorghi]|nr:hypothetical protein E4U53_006210 [Claviceps sorghi]
MKPGVFMEMWFFTGMEADLEGIMEGIMEEAQEMEEAAEEMVAEEEAAEEMVAEAEAEAEMVAEPQDASAGFSRLVQWYSRRCHVMVFGRVKSATC